ncbi:hypothetical protein [Sphingobacterium faecium]
MNDDKTYKHLCLALLFLLNAVCFAQEVKPIKNDSIAIMKNLEPFGLIQQRKPIGNFIADFNAQTDFIVVKIDNEPYTISNKALATLIMDVSIMSSIPHWNAYISYYKNGQAVYLDAPFILKIDPKKIDTKLFRKITYHKEIIGDEAEFLSRRLKIEKANIRSSSDKAAHCFFVAYPENKYDYFFTVHILTTLEEKSKLESILKVYDPKIDFNDSNGKENFEQNVIRKTIIYNDCEFYATSTNDSQVLRGYNEKNQSQILFPLKIYYKSTLENDAQQFDTNAIQLLFGKPMTIFIESEQKNNNYILEWYESK